MSVVGGGVSVSVGPPERRVCCYQGELACVLGLVGRAFLPSGTDIRISQHLRPRE